MKPYKSYLAMLVLPLAVVALTACETVPSSNVYTTAQAGTLQEVQFGTVVAVRNITIQQNSSETGELAGGIIGAVAGSEVGKGKGQIVGGVAGAVAGGAIGSIIDRNVQARAGLEITVRLQDGRTVAVAQVADQSFNIGDDVRIISQNGKARVTR